MTHLPRPRTPVWKLLLGAFLANFILWVTIVSLTRVTAPKPPDHIGCDAANRWCTP